MASKGYVSSEILIHEGVTVVLIEPEAGDNYIESLGLTLTFSSQQLSRRESARPFLIMIERD